MENVVNGDKPKVCAGIYSIHKLAFLAPFSIDSSWKRTKGVYSVPYLKISTVQFPDKENIRDILDTIIESDVNLSKKVM